MARLHTAAALTILVVTATARADVPARATAPRDGEYYLAEMKASILEVVGDHQGLINRTRAGDVKDPDLLPQAFWQRTADEFAVLNGPGAGAAGLGDDPERIAGAHGTLLQAGRITTARAQEAINTEPDGSVALKKFVPAVFGRLVAESFRHRTGVTIKQTTLGRAGHGPRNEYNAPDAWERAALEVIGAPDWDRARSYGELVGDTFRLVKPITIKAACLPCHGEPEGSRGPYGHVREGYREGELRGGISINLPAIAPGS